MSGFVGFVRKIACDICSVSGGDGTFVVQSFKNFSSVDDIPNLGRALRDLAKHRRARAIRTPGTLPGSVVFKTCASLKAVFAPCAPNGGMVCIASPMSVTRDGADCLLGGVARIGTGAVWFASALQTSARKSSWNPSTVWLAR